MVQPDPATGVPEGTLSAGSAGSDVAVPAPNFVQLTRDELNELLRNAVAQGAGMSGLPGPQFTAAGTIDAEAPAVGSHAELMRQLVVRTPWHNERNERAAKLACDTYYPEESDEA